MNDRVAFNINFYEKYHELEILVEILRQEFGDDVFINVMCNDIERDPASLKRLTIDNYEIEARFSLGESKVDTYDDSIKRRLLQLRMIDQFTTGIQLCAEESSADYTVNLHADAWPMSSDGISTVLDELDEQGQPFGSRGYGWAFTTEHSPYSVIMDIFFIVKNRTVRETGVFDFDPKNLPLTDPNIHATPTAMILFRYGADGLNWYSDLTDALGWDGQPKHNLRGAMTPLTYEPELSLLHFNTDYFLDDYGYRFLSNYLDQYGFTTGEAIEAHISKYPPDVGLIEEYERELATHPILKRKDKCLRHEVNAPSYPSDIRSIDGIKHLIKSIGRENPLIRTVYRFVMGGYRSVSNDKDTGVIDDSYHDNLAFLSEVAQQLDKEPPLEGVLELETGSLNETNHTVFSPSRRDTRKQD